jgi:desulfoferrodoxin-like iron-binding protein
MQSTRQNAGTATSNYPFFFFVVVPDEFRTWAQWWRVLSTERQDCRLCPNHTIRGNFMVNVSKEGQVFKCEICYNVVVVKEAGGGELICCGEPMQLESA